MVTHQPPKSAPDPPPCPTCGSAVRLIGERAFTIFYVCERCQTRGAYSIPDTRRQV